MNVSPGDCSDGELAALARGGSEQAYRELMQRHRDPIYRIVRATIGNADEALDIVQESFASAFSALGRYDADRPFRTWLSRIAINKCRDWARRRTVRSFFTRAVPLDQVGDLVDEATNPELATDSRLRLQRVMAQIATLPFKLRSPLVLHAIDGHSHAAIAEILGISPKAVETRIYRARKALLPGVAPE